MTFDRTFLNDRWWSGDSVQLSSVRGALPTGASHECCPSAAPVGEIARADSGQGVDLFTLIVAGATSEESVSVVIALRLRSGAQPTAGLAICRAN